MRRSPGSFREWRTSVILLALSALLCLVSAEVAARAFWRLRDHVPLRHPSRILYAFYPPLRWIDDVRPTRGDGHYNVLMLGGSTLHHIWGPVEAALAEQLAYAGRHDVRIFNLAMPAHTSRDSWLKYAALGPARFDLVLVYDGFNDARANYTPPGTFREDYGHYAWYEMVNALAAYHRSASFALPYTLRYIAIGIRQALTKDRYVPIGTPRGRWLDYCRDVRSVVAFQHNLELILDVAARRGDRVLLMTFASYVPANYSLQAFEAKRLGYGLHVMPMEEWGRPACVLKSLAAHNEVVRRLAKEHSGVLFVDQAMLMGGSPRYFNDPCHLTVAGASRFAENIVARLSPLQEAVTGVQPP